MQFTFGSGYMSAIRTDQSGTVSPVQFGTLQEGSIEFSSSIKELFGMFQFPVAAARGTGKIAGKAKFAAINAKALNDLFFNGTAAATGHQKVAVMEAGTVPATPYTITVANSATWVENLGVYNANTGVEMTQVASAPATGQYSVAAGVYTFAAADTTVPVMISYRYSVSASGKTLTISNQLLGINPVFQLTFSRRFNGKESTIRMVQCVSTKLSLMSKLEDFDIPEFEFSCYANAANVLGYISADE